MESGRALIVNADDFGQSPGINRGIIHAHEHGIVTSASLMVRWPGAMEAAAYAREHSGLSLGLHLDFGEWIYREKAWHPFYEVVCLDDPEAVFSEASRQLACFQRLVGNDPSHLDSHQHVHLRDNLQPALLTIAQKLGVPLRRCHPSVRYCGAFYGQSTDGSPIPGQITVGTLLQLLSSLPPGVTELSCHPGESDNLETMYRKERCEELHTLCAPLLRAAIQSMGIQLCSFSEVSLRAGAGKA